MSLVPQTFLQTSHAWHAIAMYLYYLPEFFHITVADPGEGPRGPVLPLLIFTPNWSPNCRKILGGRPPPPPPLLISRSESGTALVHLEGNSILDILCSLVRAWTMWFTSIFYFLHFWIERRSRYVTLPWQQYFWISKNRGPAKMAEKTKKLTCLTLLCMIALRNKTVAHTFLPSFECNWPPLSRKIVEIQKFCYHW